MMNMILSIDLSLRLNLMNSTISSLSPEQRQAFGSWFSQTLSVANMTAGGPSFVTDSGHLIAYLPFRSFQNLSPAQVTPTPPLPDTRTFLALAGGLSPVRCFLL